MNKPAASSAYLRSLAADAAKSTLPTGDAARGQKVLEGKGTCQTCQRVSGNGSRFGPELTEIGTLRRSADLQRSIVDPDAEVTQDNRTVRAVMKDGTVVIGRLLNWDTFTVQLIDTKDQLRLLQRSTLKEFTIQKKSGMPSFKDKLSAQELSDVVAYLSALRGTGL